MRSLSFQRACAAEDATTSGDRHECRKRRDQVVGVTDVDGDGLVLGIRRANSDARCIDDDGEREIRGVIEDQVMPQCVLIPNESGDMNGDVVQGRTNIANGSMEASEGISIWAGGLTSNGDRINVD